MEDPLYQLKQHDKEIKLLIHCRALLDWDQETYMPEKAIDERAEQIALLERLIHERVTSPAMGSLLEKIGVNDENPDGPGKYTDIERALVREMYRRYRKAIKLPDILVAEIAQKACIAQSRWAVAKRESDFTLFAPHLQTLVSLIREKADHLGYNTDPYEPLLDDYEPWMDPVDLDRLFENLKPELKVLQQHITEKGRKIEKGFLSREYAEEKQKTFGLFILEKMGFDERKGRLDISAHPFTTSAGSSDVRLTTRYNRHNLNTGVFGIIHECGHGLYDLGFSRALWQTLLANGTSLGIHESQSRLWENIIGKGLPFWQAFYPRLQALFPESLGDVDVINFYRGINAVEPSFIRVEADELTYNLHIILRYTLEKALINEELTVHELPEAWREESAKLLGIKPERDADGVLQDIHWSGGAFGYFPTYTLGNLYSAQFYMTMKKEIADIEEEVKKGNLLVIRDWLTHNIHIHGSVYPALKLCRKVTGEELNPHYFIAYLTQKYGEIYGI
jgi:carboxypeptidase Taq